MDPCEWLPESELEKILGVFFLKVIYSFIYPFMDSNRSYVAHSPAAVELTVEGKELLKLSQLADTCYCSDLFGEPQNERLSDLSLNSKNTLLEHHFLSLKKSIRGFCLLFKTKKTNVYS